MAVPDSPRSIPYSPVVAWHVVLDSTAISREFPLAGSETRFLLTQAPRQGFRICVPEVVVREVVNHYREDLTVANDQLEKFLAVPRDLVNLLAPGMPDALTSSAMQSAVVAFDNAFRGRLIDHGVHIEPLPPALSGVDALLRRDLDRRKPFGDQRRPERDQPGEQEEASERSRGRRRGRSRMRDRSGLRDALIWETILELCRREPGSLAFITDNVSDFANDPQNDLHPDLLDDLAAIGLQSQRYRIEYHRNIRSFSDAHLRTSPQNTSSGSVEQRPDLTPPSDESERR